MCLHPLFLSEQTTCHPQRPSSRRRQQATENRRRVALGVAVILHHCHWYSTHLKVNLRYNSDFSRRVHRIMAIRHTTQISNNTWPFDSNIYILVITRKYIRSWRWPSFFITRQPSSKSSPWNLKYYRALIIYSQRIHIGGQLKSFEVWITRTCITWSVLMQSYNSSKWWLHIPSFPVSVNSPRKAT